MKNHAKKDVKSSYICMCISVSIDTHVCTHTCIAVCVLVKQVATDYEVCLVNCTWNHFIMINCKPVVELYACHAGICIIIIQVAHDDTYTIASKHTAVIYPAVHSICRYIHH